MSTLATNTVRLVTEDALKLQAVTHDVLETRQRKLVSDTSFNFSVGLVFQADVLGDDIVASDIVGVEVQEIQASHAQCLSSRGVINPVPPGYFSQQVGFLGQHDVQVMLPVETDV